EGCRVLEEALALTRQTGEGLYEAELHRLRGEMLEATDEPQAVENYRRALDSARRKGAKSLELRAALSLARPDRGLGRIADARELLAEAYGGFTEGFQTPDLQEARALLDSLA